MHPLHDPPSKDAQQARRRYLKPVLEEYGRIEPSMTFSPPNPPGGKSSKPPKNPPKAHLLLP